jgi:hypothetical protein
MLLVALGFVALVVWAASDDKPPVATAPSAAEQQADPNKVAQAIK